MQLTAILAILIFLVVMGLIMTEKFDRTVLALGGAMLMVLLGVIPPNHVIGFIDFDTIGLLIGMMIIVSVVKNSGMFEYIAIFSAKRTKGNPLLILISFAIITALLSSVLNNVTTVLIIGPMTLVITKILKISPIPFLMAEIFASNIGGTATLIGDPPNIMIGSAAGLDFMDFIMNSGLVSILILAVTIALCILIYKKQLCVQDQYKQELLNLDEKKAIKDKPLLIKSIVVLLFVMFGFIFGGSMGLPPSIIAISGAAVILLIGKQDVDEIMISIEWSTILFFAGLFVVVGGLEESGVMHGISQVIIGATQGKPVLTMILILWLSAIVSSFLDNIPFVATLIPIILAMSQAGIDTTPLWWAVSLGACLGGNGTLIGASANVVLANVANKNGYDLSFKRYIKVGFPLMLISILISTIYLLFRFA